MRSLGLAIVGAIGLLSTGPLAAQETREALGAWTLEERRNPDEPRDYSVVVSRKLGPAELVAKRGTVRGRQVSLRLGDCTDVSFGNDFSNISLAEQIQAIREGVASNYADNRAECRLPPLNPKLLDGFDEAYRAGDARFRANRPPPPVLDRTEQVGGWTIDDAPDPQETGGQGKRLVSMTKSAGGLKLRQTVKVDLFFNDLFFSEHELVADYSDCRREVPLAKFTEAGGPAETAAQRKAVLAGLAELEKDCQLPHDAGVALLADYAPAFAAVAGWSRRHVTEGKALQDAADAYASRLAEAEYGDVMVPADGNADAAMSAADAAAAAAQAEPEPKR